MRFHTTAAIVVLFAAGAWVVTGKYTFVGSEIAEAEPAEAAAATGPKPAAENLAAPADVRQTVAFAVAEPSPYQRWIRLSGRTEADKQVVLVARTAGAVAALPVSEGDSIENGGLVMAIDGPEKYAAVESAEAQFNSAARVAEANQKLYARGAMNELQYEATVASREAARSALESARAEVDRLEVRTPFPGIVDKVFIDLGSWVQPGSEVVSLLALDPIIAVGEVNERDLQAVSSGTQATVTLGDGTVVDGTVRYVRREATGLTRTFPIEVAIANPGATIPAGMSAEIKLAVQTAPVVVLPRSAITLDVDGNLGVRILAEADTVAFLKVTIVDDTPDGLVLAGIPQGTRIIVSGQDMVGDGQQVVAVEAASDQDAN